MSSLMAVLLMQFVVSVKAGLVNHVQGDVNVAAMSMVREGHSVRTGRRGHAEVLLTPGAFLRQGENSQTLFESVEFDKVSLVVQSGPAIIEVGEISKHTPIRVKTGNLTMMVTQPGIYRFENGSATVLEGKLRTGDSKFAYEKGWQVFYQDNYRARKSPKPTATSLDVYSQQRSARIATANYNMASVLHPTYSTFDCWLYDTTYGFYTYIPRRNFRSPYGLVFYGPGVKAPSSSSPGNNGNASNPGTPIDNNSGNSGGATSAPAVTIVAPSGEPTAPAVYIESKNSTVGATQ